jgi:hypothetical protein
MRFKDLVGHKVIYETGDNGYSILIELEVVELSPSGERIKIKYPSGHEAWEKLNVEYIGYGGVQDSRIVEDLGKVKITRKPNATRKR